MLTLGLWSSDGLQENNVSQTKIMNFKVPEKYVSSKAKTVFTKKGPLKRTAFQMMRFKIPWSWPGHRTRSLDQQEFSFLLSRGVSSHCASPDEGCLCQTVGCCFSYAAVTSKFGNFRDSQLLGR